MYNHRHYANGVEGVFVAQWRLACKTPLVVRNGLSIAYAENSPVKGRGHNIAFKWKKKEGSEHEVSGLHFDYEVNDGQVSTFHSVPASSVRGALRSWTIRHLVSPEYQAYFKPPGAEGIDTDYLEQIKTALTQQQHGYQLIASVFGLALDTRQNELALSNAGRLRVVSGRFEGAAKQIVANGNVIDGDAGPDNASRQMGVRNPADRITHASRDGGLHHFLEFCAGESFTVKLRLRNPEPADLGLVSLWAREIEQGMLRFGAQSNIGRGAVSIADATYTLWRRPGGAGGIDVSAFEPAQEQQDILAGLWQGYTLPAENLPAFEEHLVQALT